MASLYLPVLRNLLANPVQLCDVGGRPVMSEALLKVVSEAAWSTVGSSEWRFREHINVLEVRAAHAGVRWAFCSPESIAVPHFARLLLVTGSSVAFFALRKDRSTALVAPLRGIAAILLASGWLLHPFWVPSEVNPADEGSRPHG